MDATGASIEEVQTWVQENVIRYSSCTVVGVYNREDAAPVPMAAKPKAKAKKPVESNSDKDPESDDEPFNAEDAEAEDAEETPGPRKPRRPKVVE